MSFIHIWFNVSSTKRRAKGTWWNILMEEYSSILLDVVLSVARGRQVTDAHSWLDCLFSIIYRSPINDGWSWLHASSNVIVDRWRVFYLMFGQDEWNTPPEEPRLWYRPAKYATGILFFEALPLTDGQKSLWKYVNFRSLDLREWLQKGEIKGLRPTFHSAPWDMLLTALSAVWHAGLTILGFFGNLVVFLTISVDRKLHLKRYVIMASLALCDFLCAVLVLSFRSIARWKEAWVFGMPWCYGNAIFARLSYAVTVAHLCAISYDRWVTYSHRPPQTDTNV